LSIIGLTLLVKGVFFPLTQMSFRSSQAMQAVQPKVLEIKAKYENDPEELNRQMIKLWRENGVNPAGGCIPMLVQLPVWLALYQVLLTSVDLYHTKFLYLDDLSAPDPYGVLPLMAVVLMVAQQQMMPVPNMDPTQAKILKIMPIAFGLLFFTFPSGLVVYIFVNTVLTMVQQWLIKRSFGARTATQGSAA
jgi:YidC/Oxa1 family membrane protein insertase